MSARHTADAESLRAARIKLEGQLEVVEDAIEVWSSVARALGSSGWGTGRGWAHCRLSEATALEACAAIERLAVRDSNPRLNALRDELLGAIRLVRSRAEARLSLVEPGRLPAGDDPCGHLARHVPVEWSREQPRALGPWPLVFAVLGTLAALAAMPFLVDVLASMALPALLLTVIAGPVLGFWCVKRIAPGPPTCVITHSTVRVGDWSVPRADLRLSLVRDPEGPEDHVSGWKLETVAGQWVPHVAIPAPLRPLTVSPYELGRDSLRALVRARLPLVDGPGADIVKWGYWEKGE